MIIHKLSDKYFTALSALFISTLIISNIASVKMVSFQPFVFDAGTILFPLAYIVGDIISEIYGYKKMRYLVLVGAIMLLLMSLTFFIVGLLPADASWSLQNSYNDILGVVWRIVFASIAAMIIGEVMNSYVLSKLKFKSQGKKLWNRLIGSSAVGAALDTVIFSSIAFAGTMPFETLLALICTVYLMKMAVEVAVSPLTMVVIKKIKRNLNIVDEKIKDVKLIG